MGKRFHQSASGMAGATTMTDYHDKTLSVCNTRASISHHTTHIIKKPCCVRNENLLRGNNGGVVFKNSYAADDDDDNFTITSNPFIERHRGGYNSAEKEHEEDFEFSKII
jgi:hypothetical protein